MLRLMSADACRICFDEDTISALEQPCGCTGTQRYAHHACIQKWINEKGHLKCEICEQQYKAQYTVPPPPPPLPADHASVVAPVGSLYVTIATDEDRTTAHGLLDPYEADWDDHRQPTVSWCFSFMLFILFMVVLHHTISVSVAPQSPDTPDASAAAAGEHSMMQQASSKHTTVLYVLVEDVYTCIGTHQVRWHDTNIGGCSMLALQKRAGL